MPGFWDYFKQFNDDVNSRREQLYQRGERLAEMFGNMSNAQGNQMLQQTNAGTQMAGTALDALNAIRSLSWDKDKFGKQQSEAALDRSLEAWRTAGGWKNSQYLGQLAAAGDMYRAQMSDPIRNSIAQYLYHMWTMNSSKIPDVNDPDAVNDNPPVFDLFSRKNLMAGMQLPTELDYERADSTRRWR